jgi:hypothetical protein
MMPPHKVVLRSGIRRCNRLLGYDLKRRSCRRPTAAAFVDSGVDIPPATAAGELGHQA